MPCLQKQIIRYWLTRDFKMAKLEYKITFDIAFINKLIRLAEANVFDVLFEDDGELQQVLNINGISNNDDDESQ